MTRPWRSARPLALAGVSLLLSGCTQERGTGLSSSALVIAYAMFGAVLVVILGITIWSARRSTTRSDFYSAGASIPPWLNGIAIAGDFLSAAALLGITALIYKSGFDGIIYALGFLIGWPITLFLMSERLRNLGQFGFADAVSFKLDERPVRLVASVCSLTVVILYLGAQMIGAGKLIELLFGIPYRGAVLSVSALVILYVAVGGMHSTTWVQVIKAVLLLIAATLMTVLALGHFSFHPLAVVDAAVAVHPAGDAILRPGSLFTHGLSAISLGAALAFGTAGLPHVLMRFFTVRDAAGARRSVFVASSLIAYFCLVIPMLGFAAIALLMGEPRFFDHHGGGAFDPVKDLAGGANMVVIHLADLLGGPVLLGFVAAVSFATILAVVSGLVLSGASAISHDIYARVLARGRVDERVEVRMSRAAVVTLAVLACLIAFAFADQNVAFMASLALAVAASCNFPMLAMALFWPGTTTRGIVAGGLVGLVASVTLIVLSPTVWVTMLGFAHAPVALENPALLSMAAAFLAIWLGSITDGSAAGAREREMFAAKLLQAELGDNPLSGDTIDA